MCRRSASVLRPRLAVGVSAGSAAANIDDAALHQRQCLSKFIEPDRRLGHHAPIGRARHGVVRDHAEIVRFDEPFEGYRRTLFVDTKVVNRLAHLRQILLHHGLDRRMRPSARGDDCNRGSESGGSPHYVMPTSLLSPSMNRYAAGLRCVRVIFTFLPIRLASMRPSTEEIIEFSSTIEFSISQFSRTQPLPIDVYGPTYACVTRAPAPMIDGPRTTESTICAPSSTTTFPSIEVVPSILPRTMRSNVSSTVR